MNTPKYWADKLRAAREMEEFDQIVDEIGKEAGVQAHDWWGEYLYVNVPMTDFEEKIPAIQQGLAPPVP